MKNQAGVRQLLSDAWAERRAGQYDEARALVDRAEQMCPTDAHALLGRVYHVRMQLASDHGLADEALRLCQRSLDYYRAAGDPQRIAHSMRHVADLERRSGRHASAARLYEEALDIYRGSDQTSALNLANLLRGYALALQETQQIAEATNCWKEARDLYDQLSISEGVHEADHMLEQLKERP